MISYRIAQRFQGRWALEESMARLNETWKVAVEGAALATELHSKLKISHRQAKGLIDAGCVKVNGQPAHGYGLRLKPEDGVDVSFDPDMVYSALPRPSKSSDTPFEILWEDKHLVFVNKPAGLLTVPAEKHHDPCLAEALTDHYRRRGFKRFHLFIAHRLDRYTSGVLVFAKTPEALNGLKNIFEEHHLRRVYLAILVGELPENAGTLSDKLVERKSLKMTVVPEGSKAKQDVKGARLAVTHYRVLERLPGHTVVEVKLETGRRNQIRVQFAERGFPLLGDQVYGTPSDSLDRQALHAELLGFRHPVTDEAITVTAPMPADMETVLKALRNARRVVRAEAGITGEADLYKPKITKDRKIERRKRSERFSEPEAPRPARPRAPARPGASARPGAAGQHAPRPRTAAPRPATRKPSK
jgi:23S rRNA pseudouridine1911/1915/1917 synthase